MSARTNNGPIEAEVDGHSMMHLRTISAGLRILLTDTKRWAVGARLGMVFADLGCEVAMLCPREGHPAHTVNAIQHRFEYNGMAPLKSLRSAMERFRPDLIVPTCDRGVNHLHRLHAQAKMRGESDIAACIERSLGPEESFSIVSGRYELLMLAREEGILIPETIALREDRDSYRIDRLGLPVVLKSDGTWGGTGVMVARSEPEVRQAYEKLRARQGIAWLVKELALNRDRGNTLHDWKNFKPSLIAQAWIEGHPANCTVSCWEGKVLACIAVEVISSNGDRGPASVVEVVEGREMMQAADKLARRMRLSGFFGLDFIIERKTGDVYLIEMNPRSTQPSSLQLGPGRNLPVAICAQIAGVPEPVTEPVTTMKRIAYFPKAADAGGPKGEVPKWSYYYDVPPDVPEFVERLLSQWPERSLAGRLFDGIRGIAREQERPVVRPDLTNTGGHRSRARINEPLVEQVVTETE